MINNPMPQLLPGEKVVWEGRPYTGLFLRPTEAFLIPFSLLWGGFAMFWNANVWTTDADLSFKLFGLPFLVMGFYVTVGRFLLDIAIRRRTIYAITNQRILILRQSTQATKKSLDIKRLPGLELDERVDGAGTIRFGSSGGWLSGGQFGIWQPTFDPTPQFIRIENARWVYQKIQEQSDR